MLLVLWIFWGYFWCCVVMILFGIRCSKCRWMLLLWWSWLLLLNFSLLVFKLLLIVCKLMWMLRVLFMVMCKMFWMCSNIRLGCWRCRLRLWRWGLWYLGRCLISWLLLWVRLVVELIWLVCWWVVWIWVWCCCSGVFMGKWLCVLMRLLCKYLWFRMWCRLLLIRWMLWKLFLLSIKILCRLCFSLCRLLLRLLRLFLLCSRWCRCNLRLDFWFWCSIVMLLLLIIMFSRLLSGVLDWLEGC